MTTPILGNFVITPRIYGDTSFNLIDPLSNNTNPAATFSFTSSEPSVAEISNIRTVSIRNSGVTTITARQAATPGFTIGEITAIFTVNKANTIMGNFTISPIEWNDGSFNLTDPDTNNPTAFSFESLTPDIITVSNRIVRLLRVGRAQIKASQNASTNHLAGSTIATFDVLSSIVRVGTNNRIDLSWNTPIENGATIKNYFFYNEERRFISTTTPSQTAPPISTVIDTIAPINASYYSYVLPIAYSMQILSATTKSPTGIDVNSTIRTFDITTLPEYTRPNFFDLGYYGEIEVSWEYHNDRPIVELNPNASTTMTLSIYKTSTSAGDNRVDLLFNSSRFYDASVNCYGPMPQNNNKIMTDIFPITFQSVVTNRDLKYMKLTDVISGRVSISNNTYSPINDPNLLREYSIIIKSIRIAPFRFPISRDFTSLPFGMGVSTTGVGFSVSTFNALSVSDSSGGIIYHMPKMTQSIKDFNKASWTFTWNYAANLSKLATDISILPVGGNLSANLNIPFNIRIRGYSRPYAKTKTSITDYNTTSIPAFLMNVSDASYNTRLLFDVSLNDSANFAKIAATDSTPDASFGIVSHTFDISGSKGFPSFTEILDYSHTQFVFLFQLTIPDTSYNSYFKMMNSQSNSFQIKMLSQTFTPHQTYRFAGPDPTLETSNSLISATNTIFNIDDYYTPIKPFYSFFDLSDGTFYSYRIASHNIIGTSQFSQLLTRRCGSLPNTIINNNTFTIESERTTNRVNIFWVKPPFTGYEIKYFIIQMMIDLSGRWLNSIEYTPDVSSDLIAFNTFDDIKVYVTNEDVNIFDKQITTYTYKSDQTRQLINQSLSINTLLTGNLINGYKYYFRLASVNELGRSPYSSILSGIPFSVPPNSPTNIIQKQHVKGDRLVILTWQIPDDDGGSPILNYIIDYQEVYEGPSLSYGTKKRYIQNEIEYILWNKTNNLYPFDNFRKIYTDYKKISSLTTAQKNDLIASRNQLYQFVIPPRPITINNTDKAFGTDISNIILSFDNPSYTYKSALLNQNVFDISNIQLKWYYVQDTTNGNPAWFNNDISLSFHLSIRADLEHDSIDRSRDISGIFDISGIYTVFNTINTTNLSNPINIVYNYIGYTNGNIITDTVPVIYTPTLPRIDHNNGQGYFLKLIYSMSILTTQDNYRFNLNSGQVIINGTAPIRTNPTIKTEFTAKISSNPYSPLDNDKTYRFTVTPLNINDFFPDPLGRNQVTLRVGSSLTSITNMSYSLISNSLGGIVTLRWGYRERCDYYINIKIPEEYVNNDADQEYPLRLDLNGSSILVSGLTPINDVVTYSIPSNLPNDILTQNAQKYLKSGRGYHISVSPVEILFVNNDNLKQIAPARDMFASDTYIIPFREPNRPLSFSSQGNNGYVTLKWILPDFKNDPNFYNTYITTQPYYRYKYFTLDQRDINSSNPLLQEDWRTISNEIVIPTPENGGIPGYQVEYNVLGITNENYFQFRIRTVIVNEYNGQRAFSDYRYMSIINNISVPESSGNFVYPSQYPYKPSRPFLRFADRTNINNGLTIRFDYPNYNGNAEFYECDVDYTPVGSNGLLWYDIFNANNGIADLSNNINLNRSLFTTNRKLRTISAATTGNQTITILCKSTVLRYGIRIRLYPRNGLSTGPDGFYPIYGASLYSDYSNIDYIDI